MQLREALINQAPSLALQRAAADEIARLDAALKRMNSQAEHFEREWYLRGDEIERLNSVIADLDKQQPATTKEN